MNPCTHDIWTVPGIYQNLIEGASFSPVRTRIRGGGCSTLWIADTRWSHVILVCVCGALYLVLIPVIYSGKPGKQNDPTVAEDPMQEQLATFVLVENRLKFAYFGQSVGLGEQYLD